MFLYLWVWMRCGVERGCMSGLCHNVVWVLKVVVSCCRCSVPRLMGLLNTEFGSCHLHDGVARGRMSRRSNVAVAAVRGFRGNASNGISLNAFLLLLGTVKRVSTLSRLVPSLPPSTCLVGRRGGIRQVERGGS